MKRNKKVKTTKKENRVPAILRQIEVDARTETKELIGEVSTNRSYELLRIFRIKYMGCPYAHIDLRFWQIDPGQEFSETEEVTKYPTRRGCQIPEDVFIRLIDYYLGGNKNVA